MIDLRSDTVTKPTPAMLEAMWAAKVGDDVYHEDETVNKLEHTITKRFGKDRALFFPSGTMANQTAIKLHTNPGEQVICDAFSHIYNYEGGGVSFNSGVSCKLIHTKRGLFTAEQVEEAINPPDFYHSPLTRLVEIENTTNKGGGACWDLNEIKRIKTVCNKHGLKLHLDGARLWNALVYKNEDPMAYGTLFDSISVCLSKGLGCPVGSVLIADDEFINKAIRIRKILGGGMRQIGYLAAAGAYALDHHVERLKIDHDRANAINKHLQSLPYVKAVEPTETNIVIFYLNDNISIKKFVNYLTKHQIKISNLGEGKWRIVTHLDYSASQHNQFLQVLLNFKA